MMKKILCICVAMTTFFVATNAATRAIDTPLPAIEMSSAFYTEASVEPLNAELYLEVATHLNEYAEYLVAAGAPLSATKINQWLVTNKQFFTNQRLLEIQETLKNLDEQNYQTLTMVNYKDPTVALILSILVGGLGVDRFYIGHTGLGIGKLLTAGGLGVWWLIDIFCIDGATKEVNYEEYNRFLAML